MSETEAGVLAPLAERLEVRRPDLTFCLSRAAFEKHASQARPGSTIYLDSGLVSPFPVEGVALLGAPFTQLAGEWLGKTVVANIVTLGAIAAHAQLASKEVPLAALAHRLPATLFALSQQALELGFSTSLEDFANGG